MNPLALVPGLGVAKALAFIIVEAVAEWVDEKINSGHYARRKARGCRGCKEAFEVMVAAPVCPLPVICVEHREWNLAVTDWAHGRYLG